jgi:hypothetical protein
MRLSYFKVENHALSPTVKLCDNRVVDLFLRRFRDTRLLAMQRRAVKKRWNVRLVMGWTASLDYQKHRTLAVRSKPIS